jgi:hypothetical protein
MVSRDFIKHNKKELYPPPEQVAGNPLLKNWIKTGLGRNQRRKVVVVGNEGMKTIRKQEIFEIARAVCNCRKFENQKKIIDNKIQIAFNKSKERNKLNKMKPNFSSFDLLKLREEIEHKSDKNSRRKHKKISSYLSDLIISKARKEAAIERRIKKL